MQAPRLALVTGEPAGIGPELCVRLIQRPLDANVVAYADPDTLRAAARALDLPLRIVDPEAASAPGVLPVHAIAQVRPTRFGFADTANAASVFAALKAAAEACIGGERDGLVTGPIHKATLNDAGIAYTGTTELLAQWAGCDVVMMLARTSHTAPAAAADTLALARTALSDGLTAGEATPSPVFSPLRTPDRRLDALATEWREKCGLAHPDLRVALVTTHLPLRAVPDAITAARLTRVIEVLHHDLVRRFAIAAPRIAVLGLNPHAGEAGHLGREEIDVIIPVLSRLREQGMDLIGPLPADTAFLPQHLAQCDVVLAMYHDQGLPVLKHAGIDQGINITLGLPYPRVAVDHGTALDLAGRGVADASSLCAAFAQCSILARGVSR
ncbi:MAG: 4-hydroxythreonine-4-phosphate dehydrogenase PdxA [Gammaproteobacteria bacterium HGW-Gammaproteobacteria-4]|jgi:4-hydroxythreonine-4-phosphate dehydrogenase|nr:MAG: 4-hydroxythreonine-4-phosphate dehydrogenase PdxA [Gammaproteobacteria bacterium HGW-Gammaproteobacteria-4]